MEIPDLNKFKKEYKCDCGFSTRLKKNYDSHLLTHQNNNIGTPTGFLSPPPEKNINGGELVRTPEGGSYLPKENEKILINESIEKPIIGIIDDKLDYRETQNNIKIESIEPTEPIESIDPIYPIEPIVQIEPIRHNKIIQKNKRKVIKKCNESNTIYNILTNKYLLIGCASLLSYLFLSNNNNNNSNGVNNNNSHNNDGNFQNYKPGEVIKLF